MEETHKSKNNDQIKKAGQEEGFTEQTCVASGATLETLDCYSGNVMERETFSKLLLNI